MENEKFDLGIFEKKKKTDDNYFIYIFGIDTCAIVQSEMRKFTSIYILHVQISGYCFYATESLSKTQSTTQHI